MHLAPLQVLAVPTCPQTSAEVCLSPATTMWVSGTFFLMILQSLAQVACTKQQVLSKGLSKELTLA